MLLELVSLAGDKGRYLHAVRKPHPGYFAQSGVGLLRRHGFDLQTHAALKGRVEFHGAVFQHIKTAQQRRGFRFLHFLSSPVAKELINRRHPRNIRK